MKALIITISFCILGCATPEEKMILKILSEEEELLNELYKNPAVLEAARELAR